MKRLKKQRGRVRRGNEKRQGALTVKTGLKAGFDLQVQPEPTPPCFGSLVDTPRSTW